MLSGVIVATLAAVVPVQSQRLRPAEPRLPAPVELPEAEPSHILARSWISLRPALARLEQKAPRTTGTSGRFQAVEDREGLELRYRMVRGPLELTTSNDTLFFRARVTYWLSARGEDFALLSCGSEAEPWTASIGCMARIGWDEDWSLDSRVIPQAVIHDQRCKPKPPGINFTEIMTRRLEEEMLLPLVGAIGAALREETPMRARVEAAWGALREPVEFGRGGKQWLDYGIRRVLAAPLLISGDSLRMEIAVEMNPFLAAVLPRPGPELPAGPAVRVFGDQLRIAFDCRVPLDSLARRVVRWCGDPDEEQARGVRVIAATVRGGADRLAVSLETEGRLASTLHLVGTIRYDQQTHAVSVVGLDYSAETRAGLRGQTAAVREALREIRDRVEAALEVDMAGQVVAAASPIGRAVNRALGPRVSISGGMNQRRLLGLTVTEDAVVARLSAAGRTWLTLD